MDTDCSAIIAQPGAVPGSKGAEAVTVRSLLDSDDDCQFAGRMTVDAFRDVYVHATSVGR